MRPAFQNLLRITVRLGSGLVFLGLLACAGSAEKLGSAPGIGLNQAAGGSSLDTQLPAPNFDPQGESKYFFKEEKWKTVVPGSTLTNLDAIDMEFSGRVFSAEPDPANKDKKVDVPCCEGRWMVLRDFGDSVCRLFQIQSSGTLTMTGRFLPSAENGSPIAIAKPGYQAPEEKELRPCPPIFDGVTPGEFDFYPVAYLSERFSATGPAEFVAPHQANPPVLGNQTPTLRLNPNHRWVLPAGTTNDSTENSEEDEESLLEAK
jgi:hypothetical protein